MHFAITSSETKRISGGERRMILRGVVTDADFLSDAARIDIDSRAIGSNAQRLCVVDGQRCVLRQEPVFDGVAIVDCGSSADEGACRD